MVSAGDAELAQARAEVRQLRETISVLRAELEEASTRLGSERQRAIVQQEHDRRQNRESIDALRTQLEDTVVERNAAVQAAHAHGADEVAQLKAALDAARRSFEHALADAKHERDQDARTFRVEREHLHETIAALRARLELTDGN